MFSGRHEIKLVDGKYFIDRDSDVFSLVISYLRNGCQLPIFDDNFLEKRFE